MVSDVSINTALNQQSRTASAQGQLAQDFNEFLILLTTQLQNQDPLSPMETNEFTTQLIGFSQVEQQINLNQKLDSLVALQLSNGMGSALSYVGLDVSYLSAEAYFDGTDPVKINYALNGNAVEAKIRISDADGRLIFEADADIAAGNNEFIWDGKDNFGQKVPKGTYEVKIDALDVDGKSVSSTTVVTGRVRGVETQNGLLFLLIGDRAVSLGTVLNVSVPETTPASDPGNSGDEEEKEEEQI